MSDTDPATTAEVLDQLVEVDRMLAAEDTPSTTRSLALYVPWLVDQLRTTHSALNILRHALAAEQAIQARVRAAVDGFCHGEQVYAEHQHYCVPILTALDVPEEGTDG